MLQISMKTFSLKSIDRCNSADRVELGTSLVDSDRSILFSRQVEIDHDTSADELARMAKEL